MVLQLSYELLLYVVAKIGHCKFYLCFGNLRKRISRQLKSFVFFSLVKITNEVMSVNKGKYNFTCCFWTRIKIYMV